MPNFDLDVTTRDGFSDPAVASILPTPAKRRRLTEVFERPPSSTIVWTALAVVLAAFLTVPILIYQAQAFTDGAGGIRRAFDVPNLWQILSNTVVLAAGSTVIAVVLAVVLAKATLHIPRRLRGLAAVVPLIPLVAPGLALVIGWSFVFSPTVGYGNVALRRLPFLSGLSEGPFNVYSMPAIILVTGFDLTGVVFLMVSARLQEIRGPLEAAAQLAGASSFRSFMTITLPLLRPSIASGAAVVFLLGLGQFTAPLFLGSRQGIEVVTTAIFRMRESFPNDWPVMAALGLPLLIVGVAVVVLQRTLVGDQRKYVITASSGGMTETTSIWAAILVVGYALVAVVLPLAAVVLVAFSPFWSGDLGTVNLTIEHFANVLGDRTVIAAISNSLVTSIVAVAIAVPIGFLGALATTGLFRAPRLIQRLFDYSFQTPLAVPQAVLGVAVLYVFVRPPFGLFGSVWLFILGYLYIVLPFALRSQQNSLLGINGSLFEAARISGAGYLRTVTGIVFPLVRRGVIAGATLGLVLSLHDFAVSIMVRSPGSQVMGTKLFQFWDSGVYPEVAVMSIIMTVVTGAVLAVTLAFGGRSALKNL